MDSLQLLPQITWQQAATIIGVCVAGWLLMRVAFGKPVSIARRWSLFAVRAALLALLAALFLNPVITTTTPGEVDRSELFYVLDSSASMQMGSGNSRWTSSLNMIQDTDDALKNEVGADVRLFRFGRRLSAIEDPARVGLQFHADQTDEESDDYYDIIEPNDSDSRLLQTLRRISSRFGRQPPQGIVLFTDGRVREPGDVLKMASAFKKLGVPIHVAPQGNLSGGGDVAIVGAVAPRRIRKYSDAEISVFLRSFGYDGVPAEIQLVALGYDGSEQLLRSRPITLKSGFQPTTLTYRSETQTQQLGIRVTPQPDELATNNNSFETEIEVDHTKIRVLYIEGSQRGGIVMMRNGVQTVVYPYTKIVDALSHDPDIQVVTIRGSSMSNVNGVTGTAMPNTMAELAAFDCIILSNVAADRFDERELEWIHTWISERGGGLLMVGGEESFASGEWQTTQIADILPVSMTDEPDWNPGLSVKLKTSDSQIKHAIWRLLDDESQSTAAVRAIPEFTGANTGLKAKTGVSTVLSGADGLVGPPPAVSGFGRILNTFVGTTPTNRNPKTAPKNAPVLVAGKYGKGRSLALSVAVTDPWVGQVAGWGPDNGEHYRRFWRNLVYWLTESSSIGRRRLTVGTDKRFYKPGETLKLVARAFDEQTRATDEYEIVASIYPQELAEDSEESPVLWPDKVPRDSGESGSQAVWGEALTLPKENSESDYGMEFQLADTLNSGSASQAVRFEVAASHDGTFIDSTSIDIQILHDPFEQQNPFPNHELLEGLARETGGSVINSSDQLASLIRELPTTIGEPTVRSRPAWSRSWLLGGLLILLTLEWLMRRHYGLA